MQLKRKKFDNQNWKKKKHYFNPQLIVLRGIVHACIVNSSPVFIIIVIIIIIIISF
jgi:hypothetical protein